MDGCSHEEHANKGSAAVSHMKPELGSGSDRTRQDLEHSLNFPQPTAEISDILPSSSIKTEGCQADLADGSELKHENLRLDMNEQFSFDRVEVPRDIATTSRAETHRNILLILVGLPGSGKSTFCVKMLHSQALKWRRICQDVISNGKRGSKGQCLKQTERALKQGFSVILDRCNLTREQRHQFLQLARRLNIEAEALVLDLPTKLCIQRAVHRTGHEGGLQGKTAAAPIQRMAQSKELPSGIEGFSLVTRCQSDEDVEKAFVSYEQFNGHCQLATGSSGKNDEERNVSVHMKSNMVDNKKFSSGSEQGKRECKTGIKETDDREFVGSTEDLVNERNSSEHELTLSGRMMPLDEGARTLAFPSISTSDFQFDHEKAADIIIDRVFDFLLKYKQWGLKLVLVDLKEDSDMLVRVRRKAVECGLDSERFSMLAGDITRLHSSGIVQCRFIANTTNWRLKAGGGGVNSAIFKAAGETLEIETKKLANTLSPGTALVVPLPVASPLHISEGVTHIIHVLGPNMNPQRPNFLQGDYVEGCKLLKDAYSCLFQAFASTVESQGADDARKQQFGQFCHSKGATAGQKQDNSLDAFTFLMQSAKRRHAVTGSEQRGKHGRQYVDQRVKGGLKNPMSSDVAESSAEVNNDRPERGDTVAILDDSVGSMSLDKLDTVVGSEGEVQKHGIKGSNELDKSKKWGSWAQALRNTALHPEEHKEIVLQVTQDAIVMTDLYPKGQKHLLVVSRKDGLDSIGELRCSHVSLLQHMHDLGQTWAKSLLDQNHTLVFRMGYHSDPSMRQLHMHVISQDFDSPSLKNKKHWNSFTTSFFRDSKNVIEELENSGRVKPCGDEGTLLKIELRCHRCRSVQPNIPRLKQHIHSCQVPFPHTLIQQGCLIMAN